MSLRRTIFNVAPGKFATEAATGVSIIRVSGPNAFNAIEKLTLSRSREKCMQKYKVRELKTCSLYHPQSLQPLDKAMCVRFNGPYSFTGEDMVELHVHGSRSVIDGVLSALEEIPDFRMSYRGEFTKRAYENQKLDLIEIEGMSDLLSAKTETQRIQALNMLGGNASKLVDDWRTDLVKLRAQVEAILDFGDDEEDVLMEEDFLTSLRVENAKLQNDMKACLVEVDRSNEIIRDGVQVSLVGPPNAGKSSLLNALSNREAAIVTNVPGTTRDIISVPLNVHGYATQVSDTAGLRKKDGVDLVEQIGIKNTLKSIENADVNILVCDATTLVHLDSLNDTTTFSATKPDLHGLFSSFKPDIIVLNKMDLIDAVGKDISFDTIHSNVQQLFDFDGDLDPKSVVKLSCKENQGIDSLLNTLKTQIENLLSLSNSKYEESGILSRKRHRARLVETIAALEHVDRHLSVSDLGCEDRSESILYTAEEDKLVLIAEELRIATTALEKLTGKIDVEDVLDVLFEEFCIGK